MSTKRKASCVKRNQSIILEKLSDASNNSSNDEKEKSIKSVRKKIRSKRKKDIQEENPPEKKLNYFPSKNIYYPELFINNIEDIQRFKCGLCECICEDPIYQYCGCHQLYCKRCLEFDYESFNNQCPKCQKETKELIPTEKLRETLMNLKMRCGNYKSKCNWIGLCKDYKEHITKNCPKEIINCQNKDCVIKLPREEMPIHEQKCEYRGYICKDCLEKMEYFRKKSHKNFCKKGEIICPLGCGEIIKREDSSLHKTVCIFSEMHCPFKIFGCKDKFVRNEKETRLKGDVWKHLTLTAKCALDLKDKVNKLEKTIEEMKKNINSLNENIKNNKNNDNNQNKIIQIQDKEKLFIDDINNNNANKEKKFLAKKRESNDELFEDITPQNKNNFSLFEGDFKDINIINKNNNYIDNSLDKERIENNQIYEVSNDCKYLFHIENDTIETKNLDELQHYYVFFNKKYDIPKNSSYTYSFAIKLLMPCQWLAIGICDKKIIEENNFQFDSYKQSKGGIYCINVNQIIWNCNNNNECFKLKCNSLTREGTTISLTVKPNNCHIDLILNDENFYELTNVKLFKSDFFSPFLIFLKNCKIQTIFNYK